MKNQYLKIVCATFCLLIYSFLPAQNFKIFGGKDSYTTSFKLVNNLIVIPIEINNKKLTFIFDSGVSAPVLFNLNPTDSLTVNYAKKIMINGIGDGEPMEALHSKQNKFRLGNLIAFNQDLYIIYKDKFDLSPKLGITVHGLIGYSLLKNFVVTINYNSKKITFTKSKKYKYKRCRKCETFDLEFYKNKPYINGKISTLGGENKQIPVKLLIDSGNSDALWLFEDSIIKIPKKSFLDFLGEGISGTINGRRSRLKSFALKSFVLKNPNVAYLDTLSTFHARKFEGRNGSVGGNILKRFKIIFDYQNAKITLKKNSNYKEPFGYNLSGIELVYAGKTLVIDKTNATFTVFDKNQSNNNNTVTFVYDYKYNFKPLYKIYQVRKGSPAEKVGIQVGDYLVKINGIFVYNYTLQQLIEKFHEKDNKLVKIVVNRNGLELKYEFRLKDILK